MRNNRKTASTRTAPGRDDKKAWNTPALTRLDASDAEVATRATDDGVFTTS